jgi:hypothetical protein
MKIKQEGYIQTRGGFIDTKDASSSFKNTTFLNKDNNLFYTEGKVHLENAKFQGYEILHSGGVLNLKNTDL